MSRASDARDYASQRAVDTRDLLQRALQRAEEHIRELRKRMKEAAKIGTYLYQGGPGNPRGEFTGLAAELDGLVFQHDYFLRTAWVIDRTLDAGDPVDALVSLVETMDACKQIKYIDAPMGTDRKRTKALKLARGIIAEEVKP